MRDDMKKASIASLLALLLSVPVVTTAAVPQTLAFSARIADNGKPVTGSHTVKFAIWDCDGSAPSTCVDPTNVLWSETQTLNVSDGVLSTVLGADTTTPNPLPASIFNGNPLFVEVTFDGTVFSPRMAIHSVPYAFRADAVPWTGVIGRPALPGVKQATQYLTQSVTTTSSQLASLTVNIPAAGFVMVTGQGEFSNATASTFTFCYLREDGAIINNGFDWDAGDLDGWFDQQQSRTEVKAVTAGTHTYTLACQMSSGTASIWGASIVVAYFPATL